MMSEPSASTQLLWCCARCGSIFRKDFPFCPNDGGEIGLADSDPLIDSELDHYLIEAFLGEGAMGRVYRARHLHLKDRKYALKVLLGDLAAAQEMRLRFANEAQAASKLSHPNVVSVIDVGRTPKGVFYLVMELVEGTSLASIIDAGGPVEPVRAARLLRGVAAGLDHAHGLGLIHRDLKPDNILVVQGPDGELARIVDFGIAVSTSADDVRLTSTGMAMGTPGYIAPEQVMGRVIDARADQYALGVTLFEMLTGGRLPFEGRPMEVATAKAGAAAPSVDTLVPPGVVVPPGLTRLVARMLERDPAQRYASVQEVGRLLGRWLEAPATDVVALPPPPPARSRRAAGAAAVTVAAVAALGLFVVRPALSGAARPAPGAGASIVAPALPAPATPTAAEPAPPTTAEPATPTAAEPAPIVVEVPVAPPSTGPQHATSKGKAKAKASKQTRQPDPVIVATVAVPPPVVVAPPRPLAVTMAPARVTRVDVSGALSGAEVRRAVARASAAIGGCSAPSGTQAQVRFSVDESRRARELRGGGGPAPVIRCLVGALGAVRTDSAPDVGNAEVVVTLSF